jgi:DNA-binding NarL/FixJ family response regulator
VESVEIADVLEDGLISSLAGAIHGMVLLELGEFAEALNELITRAGGIDLPLIAGGWRPMYLELETRCYLALDMSAEARDAAGRARQEAEGFGLNLSKLMADRAEAAVAQADGRFDDAVSLAMSAVALSTEIGARVFAASSRVLAGRALVAASRVEEAVEQLSIAAEEFDSIGATRYRNQTEAQLRGIGVTVHRRTTRGRSDTLGVEALTGREVEVVELVVDHRTNREIAETLFLSTKTVETHLRNIFNKLGVSSRAEVARTMVRAREMPTTSV